LFALPSFQWPIAPRWGIYAHATSPDLFTVVAVQGHQILFQTGLNLVAQVALLQRTIQSKRSSPSVFKNILQVGPFKPRAAWVMPDAHIESFEWPCAPEWGPQDIEAECRLEASSRLQIPALDLALDYEVQRAPDGQLWVRVWTCRQTQLNAQTAQMHSLGLQLRVVTAYSHLDELARFFKSSVLAQQQLHQRIDAQVAVCIQSGDVTC